MTLAAAWVRGADAARVDELAARVVDPARAVAVLVALAAVDPERASTLLDRAEALVGQVRHANERVIAALSLVRAEVAAGRVDRALAVADIVGSRAGEHLRAVIVAGGNETRPTGPVRRVEALVAAGRLGEATAIARRIQISGDRGAALASVAAALAGRGELGRARAILPTIPGAAHRRATTIALVRAGATDLLATIADPYERAREARGAAEAVARSGRIDEALTIAAGVEYDYPRAQATASVAVVAAELGLADRAIAIDETSGYREASTTMRIAEALARAGDLTRAVVLVTAPEFLEQARGNPVWRVDEVIAGARAAAVDGRLDRALAVARSVERYPYYTARALSAAAVSAAGAGHTAVAEQLAAAIDKPAARNRANREIAVTTAERGDVDAALAMVAGYTDDFARERTLVELSRVTGRDLLAGVSVARPGPRAMAAAHAGDLDRALAIVGEHADLVRRVTIAAAARGRLDDGPPDASMPYAVAVAVGGHVDHALAIAKDLRPRVRRRDALTGIARTLAAAGDVDRALAVATAMGRRDRDHALYWIARTLGEHGRFDDATAVAAGITHDRDGAMWTLLHAATVAGHPIALTLARFVGDDRALAGLARVTADRGRPWDALAVVAMITEPYQRTSAWAHVASALGPTELPRAARSLLQT
jgi:hypothetical protein